jgi:hypothetical protein
VIRDPGRRGLRPAGGGVRERLVRARVGRFDGVGDGIGHDRRVGADPDYSHLNAALGVAMAGKAASAKTGQAVGRACTAGN